MANLGKLYDQEIQLCRKKAPTIPSFTEVISEQAYGGFLFGLTDPKRAMIFAGGGAAILAIIMTLYLMPAKKVSQNNGPSTTETPVSPAKGESQKVTSVQKNIDLSTQFHPTHYANIRDNDGYTNVRSGPGTNHGIIGKIYADTEFQVAKK